MYHFIFFIVVKVCIIYLTYTYRLARAFIATFLFFHLSKLLFKAPMYIILMCAEKS